VPNKWMLISPSSYVLLSWTKLPKHNSIFWICQIIWRLEKVSFFFQKKSLKKTIVSNMGQSQKIWIIMFKTTYILLLIRVFCLMVFFFMTWNLFINNLNLGLVDPVWCTNEPRIFLSLLHEVPFVSISLINFIVRILSISPPEVSKLYVCQCKITCASLSIVLHKV
jgi:hypothetical protein